MRTLSRHLPPAERSEMTWVGMSVVFILGLVFVSPLILFQVWSLDYMAVMLILVGGMTYSFFRDSIRFKKLSAQRVGENICSFRRSFNLRQVDPWIVRAVYEEVGEVGICKTNFAIRASDHLIKDLFVDSEDLQDAAEAVAKRAGYTFDNVEKNPFFGKVETVGDLVMFFTHQRNIRSPEGAK